MNSYLFVFLWCISFSLCEDVRNGTIVPPSFCNCRDVVRGPIYDPNNYLNRKEIEEEMAKINKIQKNIIISSANPKNIKFGIVIINSNTSEELIQSITKCMFNLWGEGYENGDNGILLTLAVDIGNINITVGDNIKNQLYCHIIEEIVGRMENNNVHKQVLVFLECVNDILSVGYLRNHLNVFIKFGIAITFTIYLFNDLNKKRIEIRSKRAESLLEEQNEIKENHNNYECLNCAICYEDYNDIKETIILSCGHKFCKECIELCVENGYRTCPICKCDIFSEEDIGYIDYPLDIDIRLYRFIRRFCFH